MSDLVPRQISFEKKGDAMEQIEKNNPKNNSAKFNFLLIAAIGIASGIAGGWLYEKMSSKNISSFKPEIQALLIKQTDLEKRLKSIEKWQLESIARSLVDFTVPSIQDLGNAFMLVDAEQEVHLTGIKFKGRIMNTQSVRHKNATFELTVNQASKQFTINQISAGNSTRFTAYIPDIEASDARYGSIRYIRSTVEFYTR